MELEIFGGIKEIGGNKVFINVGASKFLFDFGLSFNDNNQYFTGFLNPRNYNGIVDYLYLGLIPAINKIYRNDYITPYSDVLQKDPYNISLVEENDIDAFFLTHAHMDHYKFIGFLKQDTPIYMNWVTHSIINNLSENSLDPLISEILKYHEYHKIVPKARQKNGEDIEYKRAKKNDYEDLETKRKIHIMDEKKPYNFKTTEGEVIISQFNVDHSVPGACSYVIKHDGRSIVYTGDFRRHGFHSEWVDNFIKITHEENPIAIITEGTRIPDKLKFRDGSYKGDDQSEEDVRIRSKNVISGYPGLILVNFPSRNMDRILIYYELAKRFDRIFAITPRIFLFIDEFRKKLDNMDEKVVKEFYNSYNFPGYNDENFIIYLRRKGWGNFESADYKDKSEKTILKKKKYITYKEIKKDPEHYLLYLDFYMLNELIDLDQEKDTMMYINSTTDPFNEEMELQEGVLNKWLERFGIVKTETIHSSGHCSVDDLIDALEKINADNIIPIHTENPETFIEFGLSGKIVLPEKGNRYIF